MTATTTRKETAGLSRRERLDLANLENVIKDGMGAFLAVGRALEEIRERRLYRTAYQTFDDYCLEKWGFGRSHAYRLIAAADVVEDLEEMSANANILPENVAQTRPLAPLSAEQRVEVWQGAVDLADGSQPTAADVEALAEAALARLSPEAQLRIAQQEEERVMRRATSRKRVSQRETSAKHLERALHHMKQSLRHAGGSGWVPDADLEVLEEMMERWKKLA